SASAPAQQLSWALGSGGPMDEIEARFNATFAHWNIRLPPENVAQRSRGKIVRAGWAIWYLFGSDEKGEYVDYYASHLMTGDDHVRVYATGAYKALPAIQEFRVASEDPDEDARLEAEYFAQNQRVAEMLEVKGFGLRGDEPGGVQNESVSPFAQPSAKTESRERSFPNE
ncbi:MAG: hypothetical protein ACRD2L_18735, partial [Terriglobia bacterium]